MRSFVSTPWGAVVCNGTDRNVSACGPRMNYVAVDPRRHIPTGHGLTVVGAGVARSASCSCAAAFGVLVFFL